jgi:hypothetical protein
MILFARNTYFTSSIISLSIPVTYELICLLLKGLFSRPGIFNEMSTESLSSIHLSVDSEIEHDSEMKKSHPKHVTQGSTQHLYLLKAAWTSFPAWCSYQALLVAICVFDIGLPQ